VRNKLSTRALIAFAAVVLGLPASASAGPPSVAVTKVLGLQPGWVRVTVVYDAPVTPSFTLTPTCGAPTVPQSVVASTALVLSVPKQAVLDLRDDVRYLANHGLSRPCHVTALQVQMLNGSTVLATANVTISFPMDLPLSHLHPGQFDLASMPTVTSVPLQRTAGTSRYAAYPPRLIGVMSSAGNVAFIEVEELLARASVGLRGLATFSLGSLVFELGAGAEIFPGWGLDVDRLGITPVTSGVQESHPGMNLFPYSGIQPPILAGSSKLQILPAPPLFPQTTYLADVLDNRGVARCYEGGCLDVIYNQTSHTLDAINGARLFDLDPGPVPDPPGPHSLAHKPLILDAFETQMIKNLDAALRAVQSNRQLSRGELQQMESPGNNPQFPIIDLSAKTLLSSVGPLGQGIQTTIAEHRTLLDVRGLSPQESHLLNTSPVTGPVSLFPTASCVINSTHDNVTSPVSRCDGFSPSSFRCPTVDDPLRPEDLPPAPGSSTELSLLNVIPPYYASRDNAMGTCGTHSFHQYYEALLGRYADDLAPKRVIYVDGLPVTVPVPRVATSVTSGLWELYSWVGTHAGDPDLDPGTKWPDSSDPDVKGSMPLFLDAYWPAREGLWTAWANSSTTVPARCLEIGKWKGYWFSGYCIGQGQPPPGAYRNYSQMVASRAPASDVPWSLGNTYFNLVTHSLSLEDRDAAIQSVIAELKKGLPVQLSYDTISKKTIPDGHGGMFSFGAGITWYLAPEVGACDRAVLDDTFGRDGGHVVNIVGYSVAGSLAHPDPFNSYFIIENNWGKDGGYRSFYFMNFAAFKYIASDLKTHRLDAQCWSEACETRPVIFIPPVAIIRFLFPPDPEGPHSKRYQELFGEFLPFLGGQATFAGTPPSIPGVVADYAGGGNILGAPPR